MDLLSFFRPSPQQQIERLRKKVKEPHGDPANRINAARKLRDMGTEESILALLDRFSIAASPSRQDEEEKEEVLSWLIQLGDRAVPSVVRFLKRQRQVYWPFRALHSYLSSEQLAEKIEEILKYQWENPPASSDPTAQLIRLADSLHSPALRKTIELFLEHEDDDVLLAALDYLFKLDDEESRNLILECYLASLERPRIKAQVLDRLSELGWSVRGYRPKVEETLPEGYFLTRDGALKKIGARG